MLCIFPFFSLNFNCKRREDATIGAGPGPHFVRVTGLTLISVKSPFRGNAVEDFSTDLRACGVVKIGANVLFAYQTEVDYSSYKAGLSGSPGVMMTGMAQ